MKEKIIAACGNDCAACPRYVLPPYEKGEEELRHTAQLWYKIGYRDHVATNAEISCSGCSPDNWCRYRVAACVAEQGIQHCGQCARYPCQRIQECFAVTQSFVPACQRACTPGEYDLFRRAFFEKQKNLTAYQAEEEKIRPSQLF